MMILFPEGCGWVFSSIAWRPLGIVPTGVDVYDTERSVNGPQLRSGDGLTPAPLGVLVFLDGGGSL